MATTCESIASACSARATRGFYVGDNVHIAVGCYLFGNGGRITLEDFSAISSRVSIYTATDDYVDGYFAGPCVPPQFREVTTGPVRLKRNGVVGSGGVLLPGVVVGENSRVGALMVVNRKVPDHMLYCCNAAGSRSLFRRNAKRYAELLSQMSPETPGL